MPITKDQRDKVIEIAGSWIGTKYRPQARLKGCGVDCAQILIGVFSEAGLIPALNLGYYPVNVHQHREDTQYIDTVLKYANEITEDQAQPGDIVLFKVGRGFGHSGVIVSWPGQIIHAMQMHGVVMSSALEGFLKRRKRRFFTLK